MKWMMLLMFFMLCNHAQAQQSARIHDAYAIVSKSIEAQGGRAFLQSIKSLYTVSSTLAHGIPVNWIVKEMEPNKSAMQLVNNNRIMYQNWFDGKNGYEIAEGKKRKQYPAELQDNFIKKRLIDELDYLDTSLWKLQLIGEENVLNEPTYWVHARSSNGLARNLYYSKSSYLPLRLDKLISKENTYSYFYISYTSKNGLTFSDRVRLFKNGVSQDIIVIDKVINNEVAETDFR
ncbi:MAG: hypothetical protein EOO03_04810 [Chitinophagaceae bacterium]|nr:MAG: hypothetical protein EOO03_04810 [Chitinophagaceae bacterium]